jgi:hypothetical protein
MQSLQVVLASATAVSLAGHTRPPTGISCQARFFLALLGWLLMITVMILAIVTPIWFCCGGPPVAVWSPLLTSGCFACSAAERCGQAWRAPWGRRNDDQLAGPRAILNGPRRPSNGM